MAIEEGFGWCVATSDAISAGYPEKVLIATERLLSYQPEVYFAMIRALYKACAFANPPINVQSCCGSSQSLNTSIVVRGPFRMLLVSSFLWDLDAVLKGLLFAFGAMRLIVRIVNGVSASWMIFVAMPITNSPLPRPLNYLAKFGAPRYIRRHLPSRATKFPSRTNTQEL